MGQKLADIDCNGVAAWLVAAVVLVHCVRVCECMVDHLLPMVLWACRMMSSSSCVHASFLMSGLRWLCHRSLHCLPIRPGRLAAMVLHFFGPYLSTSCTTILSSAFVHGPLKQHKQTHSGSKQQHQYGSYLCRQQ